MLDKSSLLMMVSILILLVDSEGNLICRRPSGKTSMITRRSLEKQRISKEQQEEPTYQLKHFLEESLKSTKNYQTFLDQYVLIFNF